MGNINTPQDATNESYNCLKKLYSMNQNELQQLRTKLNEYRMKKEEYNNQGLLFNINLQNILLSILLEEQNKIKHQVPINVFNKVNNFIYSIIDDITKFKNKNNTNKRNIIKKQKTPYEILKLPKKFTLDQLKKAYKKAALATHPDRNNGSCELFDKISQAYLSLLDEYKLKQNDKQYNELKNDFNDFKNKQKKTNRQNIDLKNNQRFDINKFNKIYDENYIKQPEDDGYDEWIKSNSNKSTDIKKKQKLAHGFNINVFNETFDEEPELEPVTDIIIYKEPEPILLNGKLTFSELGQNKIKNFSGKASIDYTDLKEAHTKSKLIDPNKVKYEQYNGLDDIKRARSNIKNFSLEELEEIEKLKLQKKLDEEERINTLRNRDEHAFQKYDKIHQMMLDNVYIHR